MRDQRLSISLLPYKRIFFELDPQNIEDLCLYLGRANLSCENTLRQAYNR